MNVRNIVKVMNFHSLIRVNGARRKVSDVEVYENELKKFIFLIINNRIFQQEKRTIKMNSQGVELIIYIGSDFGFCSSFNADVSKFINEDASSNDKIIIGKRLMNCSDNLLFYCDKESFYSKQEEIHNLILKGLTENKYKSINIIYIKYNNINSQNIEKKQILPVEFSNEKNTVVQEDFTIEGDIDFIINSLVSSYVLTEVKICEALSWASENVQRQAFTTESLKKIDERNSVLEKENRKQVNYEKNKKIVEMNNFKSRKI